MSDKEKIEFYWKIENSVEHKRFKRMVKELENFLPGIYSQISEIRWRRLAFISERNVGNIKLATMNAELARLRNVSSQISMLMILAENVLRKCKSDNIKSCADEIMLSIEKFISELSNCQDFFENDPCISTLGFEDKALDLEGVIKRAMQPHVFYDFGPLDPERRAV